VVYIETTTDDLIVLNPRWLCDEVLGKLLGGRGHLPCDGRLTVTHLTDLFPHMDIADSVRLLTALELCSEVAAGSSYQLSCQNSLRVPTEDQEWTCPQCVGGVALVADSTAHLRYVFPRVQHAIRNSSFAEFPSEWNCGIRFRRSSDSTPENTVTVQINSEEDKDVIRIICCGDNPQTLYQLQQVTTERVIRVIDTCCPGVYLQRMPLSPRDIKEGDRPLPRAYSARDVVIAQLEWKEEVRLDEDEIGESLREVLAYGNEEVYSALRPGVELHISELPMYVRCRLATLLDPPHPHGRDWLLLAFGLGLGDDIPQIDSAEVASLSRTVCLLARWSRSQDANIRRLIDVFRQTLQRPDVEEVLLQLTPLYRPSNITAKRSACSSPATNHDSPATCTNSQINSRKSSTTSA